MDKEEIRQQQIELLESVVDYAPKAIVELKKLAAEFSEEKQEDSDEYLDFVLENSNWLIEALNATMSLLNEKNPVIDKDKANHSVTVLNQALADKTDEGVAQALEQELIPMLEAFLKAAKDIVE